ncbi:disks large-associated protein 5 [Diorhabda carinulata]|uniref:disks large-associated protein 5 n=1 Tax=Diorhabda carinulata TaxID=1163345 RepID=UPI0025A2AD3D|nr:disks large-associated protein 5 [Diorhabda carinulata]
MDLADIFRKGLQDLHKDNLDKNYKKRSLLTRKESLMIARRQTRETLMFNKRNIAADITPFITPQSNKQETKVRPQVIKPKNEESNKRYEMLKQWKEKRDKQKEAAKKLAKPVFKVCHVNKNIGLPNLENVNKQIKGKPMKPVSATVKSFAPSNHKFQPPKNVKPVQIVKPVSRNNHELKNTSQSVKNLTIKPQPMKKPVKTQSKEVWHISVNKNNIDARLGQSLVKSKVSNLAKTTIVNNVEKKMSELNNTNSSHTNMVMRSRSSKNEKEVLKDIKKIGVNSIYRATTGTKCEKNILPSKSKLVSAKGPKTSSTGQNSLSKFNETLKTHKKNCITPKMTKATSSSKINNSSTSKNYRENTENYINLSEDFQIEKVVIYDDEEITLKTPVKKNRKSCVSSVKVTKRMSIKDVDNTKDSKSTNTLTHKSIESLKENSNIDINKNTCDNKTPKKSISKRDMQTPIYISPFVTISRGKESARKEFSQRKSTGGVFLTSPDGKDFSKSTSTQAGAEYFELILDKQISRIESICENWENYKQNNNLSEEAIDMINVAIGQSKLLITKKFEQFRGLILECKSSDFKNKPITCEDLHGFWDMIYQQVIDLDKRFDNLEKIKNNNWEEVFPENKIVQTRKRGRPKKQKASSSIKEMIKAARNKIKNNKEISIQLMESKTPEPPKKLSPVKTSSSRRSLRASLLRGSSMKRMSSPGLTMMKITQAIKAGDGLTPSKSILKTDFTQSEKRHTKSVLFVENMDNISKKLDFETENKENCAMIANKEVHIYNNPTPLRRSRRLSSKLI